MAEAGADTPEHIDCLIVGGGPAGLAAAVYLARYRRRVMVVDNRGGRVETIPCTHNCPGFPDGISGLDLAERQRAHARHYGAPLLTGTVTALVHDPAGFLADIAAGDGGASEVRARTVLLATGVHDIEPALPALERAIRDGFVRHCAICDAYEVIGQRIAVIGFGNGGVGEALFMRTYTDDVTLLTLGRDMALSREERDKLAAANIRIVEDAIADVSIDGGRIEALRAATGQELRFDTLYSALGGEARSDLATALGADYREECRDLITDPRQRTTVPGLWAAGDVVQDLNQIAVAWGHAAIAATDIHRQLRKRDE